jgi:peptidoglycan/xylan/chitin deacetylase (PgdA/CDA1 family)
MALTICDWKHGKEWAYSITYDEALEELHHFAVPLHEEFGIPGHAEAVAGHIGVVRRIGNSSYNGMLHMGPAGLRDLIARGWGVGNHTWTHEIVQPETVDLEIGEAKRVLEEACGAPVPLYCAANNNDNMSEHVLDACRRYGYLGAMSITDDLNLPGDELFWLNRTPLHVRMYEPFHNAYDPYRNIRHAQARHGWIIDYCHCPLAEAIHPTKDCTAAQLRRRFETILAEGGDRVWCANPDEVIYYHRTRRAARIVDVSETEWRVDLEELPDGVHCTTLTFDAQVPVRYCQNPIVQIGTDLVEAQLVRPGVVRFSADVRDGLTIRVLESGLGGVA